MFISTSDQHDMEWSYAYNTVISAIRRRNLLEDCNNFLMKAKIIKNLPQ